MTEPNELNPETLDQFFRANIVTTHLANTSPLVHVRIDGPAQQISVLTPYQGAVPNTADLRRVDAGIELVDGARWARVTFDARNMHAEAYGLVLSVTKALQAGSPFASAMSAAMTNMKALLQAKPGLSSEKQVGLVGELLVLRSLIATYDEQSAFDSWLGPLAEEHDFAFADFDAEVKTTLGEKRQHMISGVGQLAPSPMRPLWLLSIQVTRGGGAESGFTLPGLVDAVRGMLTVKRKDFDDHLTGLGWHDDDASLYPTAYIYRTKPAAFFVDDTFPAITPDRLRAAVPDAGNVSDVSYRVDLSNRVPADPGSPITEFINSVRLQETAQ